MAKPSRTATRKLEARRDSERTAFGRYSAPVRQRPQSYSGLGFRNEDILQNLEVVFCRKRHSAMPNTPPTVVVSNDLLLESGSYLLLESGFKIILEP
jgi:hypothetical protein